MPRVSVVILSHRPEYVGYAMRSVMDQTFTDHETIVKYSPAYWPDKLEEAMRATSGEYVTLLCDDDLLLPTYLARTVAALDHAPGKDIAYTDHQVFGRLELNWNLPTFDAEVLRMYCVPWVTALFRRSVWERLRDQGGAGFDGTQPYIEWDYWIRAAALGVRAVHIKEPLWRSRESAQMGSRLMNHDAALDALRAKHRSVCTTDDIQRREKLRLAV